MRLPKVFTSSVLVGLALAAASSAPAQAATSCDRVASPSGSDSGAGTLESPYRSAAKLASSLASGQTGCFRAGTYSFGTLNLTTAQVTLAPYGSEAVTLAGHLKIMPSAANSVIEGMTLDASSSPDNTMGPKIYASGVVLRDNEITNRHSEICVIVGSFNSGPAPVGVVIKRNRIHHCGALPATNLDHGIYISAARSTIVRDNWIYDNADRGVQQYPDVKGSVITGNVIASNGQGVNFSGAGSLVTTDAEVSGNIVVDSKLGANAYSGGSGPNGTNNLFRDNCVHSLSGGTGIESNPRSFTASNNLVANPNFAAAAADDYRLQASSACLAKYTGTMSLPAGPVVQRTLTVTSGSGTGTGTVTGPGISCAGDCAETYAQGQEVTLTATATNGSTFAGWSGACSGTGACKVNMDANKSVAANFSLQTPPPLPGSNLLRPDSDLLTGWNAHGATSAWSALDESITTSTRASATDYVQPSAGGQVTTVGFGTQALHGRAVDAATLYYYGKTWSSDTQLRVEARTGGQTLATQTLAPGSTYAWRSLAVALPDQVAIDDLNLRLTAIGGTHTVVRAAYVELDLG